MIDINHFDAIEIGLASSKQIRSWSSGEVTKPETINYRTLKPEKDGLFCERIFGPTKDWECYCGKYKRVRYKGIVCERCGVEVTRSKVRRERMGHVDLAAPVSHIWFFKGVPSRIGYLLDMAPKELEKVLYFAASMVTWVDDEARERDIESLEGEVIKVLDSYAAEKEERVLELRESLVRREQFLQNAKTGRDFSDDDHLWADTLEVNVAKLSAEETEKMLKELRKSFQADIDDTEAYIEDAAERMRQVWELFKTMKPKDVVNDETTFRELKDRFGSPYGLGEYFRGGMGAEAVRDLLQQVDLAAESDILQEQVKTAKGQKQARAVKRLKVVSAFISSGNKPEMMVLEAVPVIPPELRPMVQLDGGRFATSDLNDLYRRVINRNNRLKRLLDLGAPEIIVNNEKRMLQEAVDALFDNGRRGRPVTGPGNRPLKSLSDMLKGKQGRFRQNLLGKRVDYSGRSVIVSGPSLRLHQCGLPKLMALELFKPFIMSRLVERKSAQNIKAAKKMVDSMIPEVWDVLEEVIRDHPVLLNRAPTLHRLGIQAFMPTLVEGSAIQIHPLVCFAFNADFDGDQMAVHVPLSTAAQREAKELMLSTQNLLSAADGSPVVSPTHDMVLGCYYLTVDSVGGKGEGKVFSSADEAIMAAQLGHVHVQSTVRVELETWEPEGGEEGAGASRLQLIETTPGRVIFNTVIPRELGYVNQVMDRRALKDLIARCYRDLGPAATASLVDGIKGVGFHYATVAGITIGIEDMAVPKEKAALLSKADGRVTDIEREFRRGFITDEERYNQTVEVWRETTDQVTKRMLAGLDRRGSVWMITHSGARGNVTQVHQLAGMRGLMADPSGRIIDLPIRSNLREGMSVLEYFISSHGARKGLADTALRTADSGYLTRRLVDVAQDVITREDDCETDLGTWITEEESRQIPEPFGDRLVGRMAALDVVDEKTGETILRRNEELDEAAIARIVEAGIDRVSVRAPLTCVARHGVCRMCYGRNLATGRLVELGQAVGIIAAQSIGEPGTQLTMRTFHTGGVAGEDITQGLPRVEELFEARIPKGQATMSEIDGVVEVARTGQDQPITVRVTHRETYDTPFKLTAKHEVLVASGDEVGEGQLLARVGEGEDVVEVKAPTAGRVTRKGNSLVLHSEDVDTREYAVPHSARLRVETGEEVIAGQPLTEGSLNPKDLLLIKGVDTVQRFLVGEVQKVYRSQGVSINDKHVEIIVRQMLRKVTVDSAGDTELLPSELIDRFEFEETNNRVLAEGGEPATAQTVLLGVTKASLNTSSFLAAASFQETTRVLTEAAINGAKDHLLGLKENVIIGKLIPAGTGAAARALAAARARELPPEEAEAQRERQA
ncbi:MAG: DNA-directed RNA polymerase subunit beta', partial [Solirubrobacteraceae bacterium]